MAQDNRSIVITLKLDTGSAQETQTPTDTASTSAVADKDGPKKAIAAYAAMQVTEMAVSEVINWGEYFWNRSLMLNDDYIGQRNKQYIMANVNGAINIASSIAGGAIAGSAILPGIGTAIGAVIGAVGAALNSVRSNIEGALQQDLTLNQMDAQLSFTRSRTGYSLQAASIGEDL